jgi:hypothetical protein
MLGAALWTLSLMAIAAIMPWPVAPANKYAVGSIERLLARLPRWFQALAGTALPTDAAGGPALRALSRQYSKGLRIADRAHRTLLALPMALSCLGFFVGAIQVIDTVIGFVALPPKLYSWEWLSLSLLCWGIGELLFTGWLREFIWSRRLPFEWAYLSASAWAAKSASAKFAQAHRRTELFKKRRAVDGATSAGYLDSAEAIMVNRFATSRSSKLPSVTYAAARWEESVRPLLEEKGRLMLRTGVRHPLEPVVVWLERGAELIVQGRAPTSRPCANAGATTDARRIEPLRPLFRAAIASFCCAIALLIPFFIGLDQEQGVHLDFSPMFVAAGPILGGLASFVALVAGVVSLFQITRRRDGR